MRYVFTLSFLTISLRLAGYGIADWQHTTPGGNVMGDPGNGTYLVVKQTGKKIMVNWWYFYKNHVLGTSDHGYFILDEKTGTMSIFNTEAAWTKNLHARRLVPSIWTRWYRYNWVDSDMLLIWLIFLFYISIPFLLFFAFACYWAVAKERLRPRKPFTVFVFLTLISIAGIYLLDYYPSSI